MAKREQLELDAHLAQLARQEEAREGKCRALFGWDVPDTNERAANRLVFAVARQKLYPMEKALAGASVP